MLFRFILKHFHLKQQQKPHKFSLNEKLGTFYSTNTSTTTAPIMTRKVDKTEQEWKDSLSKEQFHVLREKGTERAFTGKYDKHFEKGTYVCTGCGEPLYESGHKFNSGCGWPAFFDNIPDKVERHEDNSFGMRRVEILCKACGGHLGHVFEGEGYNNPTDERHCVNSVSVQFIPDA